MTDLTDVAIGGFAAYRLTRLVTTDDIFNRPRDALVRASYRWAHPYRVDYATTRHLDGAPGRWSKHAEHDEHPPPVAMLMTCRYCAGLHVAAGIVLLQLWRPKWANLLCRWMSFGTAAALLAHWESG